MKNKREWKPILFDGQMVRAIKENRKNVTRRLQGIPDIHVDDDGNFFVSCVKWHGYEEMGNDAIIDMFCPFYVGQKLWVKETFRPHGKTYMYRSDYMDLSVLKWKPSLFMPRKLSRIDLLVKGCGLGQLGDMQQGDFVREGFSNKEEFIELWNRKNPKDKYNDYRFVWDICFDVLEIRK
jgi:hypothetical protein